MELPMELDIGGVTFTLSKVSYSPLLDQNKGLPCRRYCFVGEMLPKGRINWFFAPLEGYKEKKLRIHESAVREGVSNHFVFLRLGELTFRQYNVKHISGSGVQPSEALPNAASMEDSLSNTSPHFSNICKALRQERCLSTSTQKTDTDSEGAGQSPRESFGSMQLSSSLTDQTNRPSANSSTRSRETPSCVDTRRGAVCDNDGFLPPVKQRETPGKLREV